MTTNQLFFAITGVFAAGLGFLKYYIDAKIDPVANQVSLLVNYMISHEGRIAALEATILKK